MRSMTLTASLVFSLALFTTGCNLATDDDVVDVDGGAALGEDESALYQGWARSPRELVFVGHVAPPVCGDGYVRGGEACDDGNHTDGDGCSQECAVEDGYTCAAGSPSACADIDECKAATAACGGWALCRNLPGSYACECKPGFEPDGAACVDVDECATGADACSAHSTCVNEKGDYACLCDAGFAASGDSCVDIDECALNPCHAPSVCANHDGGYKCECPEGYAGSDGACVDVNECEDGTAACHEKASCSNHEGGYRCECPADSEGDGFTCK